MRCTLPHAAFRTYLVQDYLFLIQFAARMSANVRLLQVAVHRRACCHPRRDGSSRSAVGRWALSPEDIEAAPEHQATVAYTRFVLDCCAAGDLLDLHVALPLASSAMQIGRNLMPNGIDALGDHPYREWISEYAGEAYHGVATRARRHLDDLAARSMTKRRFTELAALFGKASNLNSLPDRSVQGNSCSLLARAANSKRQAAIQLAGEGVLPLSNWQRRKV